MTDDLVKMARLAQRDDRMATGALYGDLADRIEALVKERDEARNGLRTIQSWDFPSDIQALTARAEAAEAALKAIDPAAIREAALREAAGVAHKCVKAFGAKMRAAPNKQEKRDWQSMLMGAVDIEHAILALIDKKEW
jgi:hypothetical protein